MIDHVASWLRAKRRTVDRALPKHLPREVPSRLLRSMRYSLLSPGKRLRPLVTLAACEALGGRERDALPAACAVEMIHTYSLIHDDLPAMDDDDVRRGKPTNHRAFDEATAILAGDALQAAAFETVARGTLDRNAAVTMIAELASAAGAAGMVGGQALDLSGGAPLRRLHAMKTAALFRAAASLGARAARAPAYAIGRLGEYGFQLGLAFQAVDDILDRENDPHAARARALRCTARAGRAVAFLGRKGTMLVGIAGHLISRSS